MNKLRYYLVCCLTFLSLTSCTSYAEKKSLIEMERIVTLAESQKTRLSNEEWKNLAKSFEENERIVSKCPEEKLENSDRFEYIKLCARWSFVYGQHKLHHYSPDYKESLKKINQGLDLLVDTFEEVE